jgi:hypothetical protein
MTASMSAKRIVGVPAGRRADRAQPVGDLVSAPPCVPEDRHRSGPDNGPEGGHELDGVRAEDEDRVASADAAVVEVPTDRRHRRRVTGERQPACTLHEIRGVEMKLGVVEEVTEVPAPVEEHPTRRSQHRLLDQLIAPERRDIRDTTHTKPFRSRPWLGPRDAGRG